MSDTTVADEDVETKATREIELIRQLLADGELVAVGFSGGKDSSVALSIALQAWLKAKADGHDPLPLVVVSGDTGIENPAVAKLMHENHAMIRSFAEDRGMDVRIFVSQPSLADSYMVQILSGRSLPTWINSVNRSCSVSLKVKPGTRTMRLAGKSLAKETADAAKDGSHSVWLRHFAKSKTKTPLVLVGSRLSESEARARNMEKSGIADGGIADSGHGTRTYAPIKDWTSDDVWEFLALAGSKSEPPFLSWRENFDATVTLYKDASGECPVVVGDKGPRAACGSRHGCSLCTVSGSKDKSMEQMLTHDKYAYMEGLNRLRNWLSNSRDRWDLRSVLRRGRDSETGEFIFGYSTYRPGVRADLLRMVLSVQHKENKRADAFRQTGSDAYIEALRRTGMPIDAGYVRRMADPQFSLITTEQLVAIDFLWSLRCDHPAFEALRIYWDVFENGNVSDIPDLASGGRMTSLPQDRISLSGVDDMLGLRDPSAELVSPEGMGPKVFSGSEMMDHNVGLYFDVNAEAAANVLALELPRLFDRGRDQKPQSAALYYLRLGAVALANGKSADCNRIARESASLYEAGYAGEEGQKRLRRELGIEDDYTDNDINCQTAVP